MNKIIVLFLLSSLLACKTNQETKQEETKTFQNDATVIVDSLKYATCFEIKKQNEIKKLIIKNPFKDYNTEQVYVLLKKEQDYTAKNNEVILNVPIKSLVPFSTSYLSMIDTLGGLNSIISVENEHYIYNPSLLSRIDSKKVKTIGSIDQLNIESVILSAPELLITIGTPGETAKQIQKLGSAGIPFINNYDWQESHPLGKAEWIKFFGALYDKETEANAIFNFIESNYNELKNQKKKNKPNVLFSSLYSGVWYIPGGNSYATQFLKDAGGTYPWITDSTKGSLPLSFETIAKKQTEPNIWLNPNYTSLESMLLDDNRYQPFINSVEGKIYVQDKKSSPFQGNDYWERGALRADLVLKDYIELFKLEDCNDSLLFFFQKIKQ